jgi:1,4-alpha-glucan branching enzyme
MPLVYNGQEAGLNKALSFFEKDTIPWTDHRNREIYTTLLNLKQNNKALWNGTASGEVIRLKTSKDRYIFAFTRQKADDKIIAVFNFSDKSRSFTINNSLLRGDYFNPLTNKVYSFTQKESFKLNPWDYLVFVKK